MNVIKAEEVIDYSVDETTYQFTIELMELEKLMISLFNVHTGVTYKTYVKKEDEWFTSNIYIFRGDFKRVYPILRDSLLDNNERLPHQEVEESDKVTVTITYEDNMYPFELVIPIPKYISKNGPLEDRINSLEYQVANLKRLLHDKREKVNEGNKIYNEVGNLIYEGSMKNGKRHGQGKEYCGTKNVLLYEGEFKDGYYEGQGILWPNSCANNGIGELYERKEGMFQCGKCHGLIKVYCGDKLNQEINFIDGIKEGKETNYSYMGGKQWIQSTCDYKDGKQHGEYQSYCYKGSKRWLQVIGHYKDGLQHGKHTQYDETGKVIANSDYNMGVSQ